MLTQYQKSDMFLTFDRPLMFASPALAKEVGVDEALVLSKFEAWIGANKNNGKSVDGFKWVRDSTQQLVNQFEHCFSNYTMRYILKKLIDKDILASRTDLNRMGFDRTRWFTVNFDEVNKLFNESDETTNAFINPESRRSNSASSNREKLVLDSNGHPVKSTSHDARTYKNRENSLAQSSILTKGKVNFNGTIDRQSPKQFSVDSRDDDAEEDVGEFDRSTSPTHGNHGTDSVQSQSSVTSSPWTETRRQMPTDHTAERKTSRKLASDRDDQGSPKLKVSASRQPRTRRASRQEARGAGFSGRGYVPVSRPADYDDRSATVDTDRLQVFRFYAENMNGGKSIPPFAVRELGFDIRNYGKGLTLEAIKQSVLNGGHTLRYIDSILESWARSGVRTIKDAKLDEKRHTAKIQADKRGHRKHRTRRHVCSGNIHRIPHAKDGALTVAYLNKYAHTRYSTKNPMYLRMISRLIGQGYTAQDFADVIKYRVQTWGDDAKMKRYIRPTTLFSMRNFDEYLNDARSQGESDGNSDAIQGLATIRHAKQEKQAELQGLKDYFGKKGKEKKPVGTTPDGQIKTHGKGS